MAASCEHGNEPEGSTEGGEVRDQLRDYKLLSNGSVQQSQTRGRNLPTRGTTISCLVRKMAVGQTGRKLPF